MPYTISGVGEAGPVLVHRDTAVGALERARQMYAEGKRDVLITDPSGQVFSPAEFERLFLQSRD